MMRDASAHAGTRTMATDPLRLFRIRWRRDFVIGWCAQQHDGVVSRARAHVGILVGRRLDIERNLVTACDNEVRGRSGDRDQTAMERRVAAVALCRAPGYAG